MLNASQVNPPDFDVSMTESDMSGGSDLRALETPIELLPPWKQAAQAAVEDLHKARAQFEVEYRSLEADNKCNLDERRNEYAKRRTEKRRQLQAERDAEHEEALAKLHLGPHIPYLRSQLYQSEKMRYDDLGKRHDEKGQRILELESEIEVLKEKYGLLESYTNGNAAVQEIRRLRDLLRLIYETSGRLDSPNTI